MRQTIWCLLALVVMAHVGVAGESGDLSNLYGKWILESINGQPTDSGKKLYFEIKETKDGPQISGFDGCNKFGGTLAPPAALWKGQRGCPSGKLLLPLNLSDPRSQLDAADVTGKVLTIPLPDGSGEADFRRY